MHIQGFTIGVSEAIDNEIEDILQEAATNLGGRVTEVAITHMLQMLESDIQQLRVEIYTSNDVDKVVKLAAIDGEVEIITRLLEDASISGLCRGEAIKNAVQGGHEDIVRLLLENGSIEEEVRGEAVKSAVQGGHEGIVRLLLRDGPICAEARGEAVRDAAEDGRENMIRLLLEGSISQLCRGQAVKDAARGGHENVVRLLLENGSIAEEIRGDAVRYAARGGYQGILGLLLANTLITEEMRGRAIDGAALGGHEDIVRLWLKNGPITAQGRGFAIGGAAQSGHENIVRLLLENGPITELTQYIGIWDAAQRGYDNIIKLLLENGPIVAELRGEAVRSAAEGGHESTIRLLLANGPIPISYRCRAIEKAAKKNHLTIIRQLLRDAEGNFIRVDIGEALLEAASRGKRDVVETLLANVPSISSVLQGSAMTNARGKYREAIRDLLRQVRIDDTQSFEQIDDPNGEWVDLVKIQTDPLPLLQKIALTQMPQRFYLIENRQAIDLGGVSKQVVTMLVDALIDKKILATDEILRLPILGEGNSREVLKQFGQFLSQLDQHNQGRTRKLLIGARWSFELFELLKLEEGASTTDILVRIIEEKRDPNYNFWIALLKDSKDEEALEEYKSTCFSDDLQAAEADFLQWREAVEAALNALRSGLTDEFKARLQTMSAKDFSDQIQGVEASAETIIAAFKMENPSRRLGEMGEWLKEWILEAKEEGRKAFLMAITGRNVLSREMDIWIRQGVRENGEVELHTCYNSIDLPQGVAFEKEEFFMAVNFAIEQKGYNIA